MLGWWGPGGCLPPDPMFEPTPRAPLRAGPMQVPLQRPRPILRCNGASQTPQNSAVSSTCQHRQRGRNRPAEPTRGDETSGRIILGCALDKPQPSARMPFVFRSNPERSNCRAYSTTPRLQGTAAPRDTICAEVGLHDGNSWHRAKPAAGLGRDFPLTTTGWTGRLGKRRCISS